MNHIRTVALVLTLFAAFGVQSLLGGSEQAAAAVTSNSPFEKLHFRSIGPASMSGRISDLAVYEANPALFYVATAHGGVWKTTNAGTTFEAQFQDQGLISIGDVTVSQSNPDLLWVGSGESNNRQSTSWGDGVYKSTNGGKTFTHMGLRSSRHINRILIDPRSNDTVFVAATGPLFGAGGDRGVFKTTDGGKTWKQVLKVDDDTGANDLVMDDRNNQVMYATTYQRRRTACCMNGGGPGSGLWKSTDGGETWTRLKGTGWPDGSLGRIAVDVYRKRPNILYALIEGPAPAGGRGGGGGGRGAAPEGAPAQGRGAGQPATTTAQPETTPEQQPQEQGRGGRAGTATGVNNTPTGLYRSDDAGATWRKVNNANPRPMYFSQIRIDPNDPDTIIYGGVGLHFSNDAGKTVFTDIAESTHDDVHAIWIDPSNSNHVIIGNDGGLAISWDQAKTWNFVHNLPVGLFYHVSVDNATPYNVCGGMQDNYNWCGPSAVRGAAGIASFHWWTLQGGDGFHALQDPTDYRIAYSESQDGNMVRVDRVTGETMSIRPVAPPGEPPIRWNWDTPLAISPHNASIIFAAGNKLFRSSNRGLTWESLGGDLTANVNRDDIVTMGVKNSETTIARNDGIVAWGTIVTFAESPKKANLLYVGTDDGTVQVSRESGRTWTNITGNIPNAPKGAWVADVVPSRFDEGTVYVTFDAHRQNDYETYIYVSRDYGATFQPATGNLKGEVVRTMTEDQRNPDVLYLGTETGLFVSIDRAKTWTRVKANLPTVRIDEITLHPRDNAMILATHGRAIWILDHLEPIQEYAAAQAAAGDAKLFTAPPFAMYRRPARDRNYEFWGDHTFYGENPPQAAVISWLNKKQVGEVKLKITDAAGKDIREIGGTVFANSNKAGIQSACWDLRVQPVPAPPPPPGRGGQGGARAGGEGQGQNQQENPFGAGCGGGGGGGGGGGFGGFGGGTPGPFVVGGAYKVSLVVDGKVVDTKSITIKDDPEVLLTSVERKRMFDTAMELHTLQARITEASTAYGSLTRQVNELTTTIAGRGDVAADVKASMESLKKDLDALAPKLSQPQGGRGGGGGGGGRGGANESLLAKVGQAKGGYMGGMMPGEQTTNAAGEVRAQTPKAIADLNAAIAKATTLGAALSRYNLTLTVPQPIKVDAAPAKKTNG